MMWPFSKKKEVSTEQLIAVLGEPLNPQKHTYFHGRPIREGSDQSSLIEKLKENRCKQGTGSGTAYWESVVDVVEKHYKI